MGKRKKNKETITTIGVLPLSFYDEDGLEDAMVQVNLEYQVKCRRLNHLLDPSDFFDATRVQYNADEILPQLQELASGDVDRLICVTSLDIFTPILTFIFGQAYLGGQVGIVSGHRLKNERYGLPPDSISFWSRMTKGIIHELGHAFGLLHCMNLNCVMRSATHVEEIDQKTTHLCPQCYAKYEALRADLKQK